MPLPTSAHSDDHAEKPSKELAERMKRLQHTMERMGQNSPGADKPKPKTAEPQVEPSENQE